MKELLIIAIGSAIVNNENNSSTHSGSSLNLFGYSKEWTYS